MVLKNLLLALRVMRHKLAEINETLLRREHIGALLIINLYLFIFFMQGEI
jgi:hypothetical protein